MPYDGQIPDAPLPLSMLPRASAQSLTLNDLLYLVQPGNNIGQRCKSLELQALAGSGILAPEKVVVSSPPASGDWTVDLGTLKNTNRLVLVQNANQPKTSCSITLSGTQPSPASLLDIVVVYGSWTGNLTLRGLSAGDYILHGADGEWMRGVIAADGRLSQYSIMGHLYNECGRGFSGEFGVDSFSIGTDGISLVNQDRSQNDKEFSVDFDGTDWNMETGGKVESGSLKVGAFKMDADSVVTLTTSGAYTDLMTAYNTINDAPYGHAYMRVVVNISSGNVEVRFLDVSGTDPSTYRAVNLSVGECAILFCTGVHQCTDGKYRNDWASIAT